MQRSPVETLVIKLYNLKTEMLGIADEESSSSINENKAVASEFWKAKAKQVEEIYIDIKKLLRA